MYINHIDSHIDKHINHDFHDGMNMNISNKNENDSNTSYVRHTVTAQTHKLLPGIPSKDAKDAKDVQVEWEVDRDVLIATMRAWEKEANAVNKRYAAFKEEYETLKASLHNERTAQSSNVEIMQEDKHMKNDFAAKCERLQAMNAQLIDQNKSLVKHIRIHGVNGRHVAGSSDTVADAKYRGAGHGKTSQTISGDAISSAASQIDKLAVHAITSAEDDVIDANNLLIIDMLQQEVDTLEHENDAIKRTARDGQARMEEIMSKVQEAKYDMKVSSGRLNDRMIE
jgi:FtsZ-binding cell division protein ZapB